MNEDELYRASTQFRYWSFTPHALADLRASTNSLAAQNAREAIARQRAKEGISSSAEDVDFLTVEEEQKLVRFYCSKAMDFADFCNFPTSVKASSLLTIFAFILHLIYPLVLATALQYLHRFYLTNSPITHHPKLLMPCSIYLASKSENHYIPLSDFASKLPKTTPADVIAPEFLLVQGLRFTFEVHHPYRALEGGCMELHDMAAGTCTPPTGTALTAAEIRKEMLALPPANGGQVGKSITTEGLKARVQKAHDKAGEILKTSAILSDVYLLYTPAQTFLAALLAADEPLGDYYIHLMVSATRAAVVGANSDDKQQRKTSTKELRLLSMLKECSALLLAPENRKMEGEALMKEVKRIDKKLFKCRNPETVDEGKPKMESGIDEKEEERAAKKRRMERERAKREESDVFGEVLR